VNSSLLKSSGIVILLVLAGFLLAYQFVEPAPPTVITLATGSPTGAYHAFGLAMRDILAANDIELKLHNSAGSDENAALLAWGTVDIALMQGGTPLEGLPGGERLSALASLYYEPLWIFHRLDPAPTRLLELARRRVNRGAQGSGTRRLADELLALNNVASEKFSELDTATASKALRAGELDALFIVSGEKAPEVQTLLQAPGIALMDLPRSKAYHLHRRYLSPLILPPGAIDLASERPPTQQQLIGVTAMLVASEDLHPALVDLLLLSAPKIVGGDGLFHSAGQFPSGLYLSIPLGKEAQRFHKRGPSFLQRFLPFWAATLIDRLVVMLIPLVALVIPLSKLFPPLYRWRVRSRIYRWYENLQRIETRLDAGSADPEELAAAVHRLETEVKQVETPLSYADQLYHLRTHINLVRARINQMTSKKELTS
jgi:TRAP transporter TAXI family solute receptor